MTYLPFLISALYSFEVDEINFINWFLKLTTLKALTINIRVVFQLLVCLAAGHRGVGAKLYVRKLAKCGLGNGGDLSGPRTILATGQLQDGTNIRIRDDSNNSPTFNSEGVASGKVEVKPSGKTAWGTIGDIGWGDTDALVACRENGNELGYDTVSGTELIYENTPDGSGEQLWNAVGCSGSEETLKSCSKQDYPYAYHFYDVGIMCKFLQANHHGEDLLGRRSSIGFSPFDSLCSIPLLPIRQSHILSRALVNRATGLLPV